MGISQDMVENLIACVPRRNAAIQRRPLSAEPYVSMSLVRINLNLLLEKPQQISEKAKPFSLLFQSARRQATHSHSYAYRKFRKSLGLTINQP